MRWRALALPAHVLAAALTVHSSPDECWSAQGCKSPVDVSLTSLGWGDNIIYTLELLVGDWTGSATLTVFFGSSPALVSIGRAVNCHVTESGASFLTVQLDGAGETCSIIIHTANTITHDEVAVMCSSRRRTACPPPLPPPSAPPPPSAHPALPPPPCPSWPHPTPPPAVPPAPMHPPRPLMPELTTVTDDCYLGVHARYVVEPSGVAGQLWKLQLDFDSWQVGVHVFAIFTKWDDEQHHISLSRFPARIVRIQPPEAMRSPAAGAPADAYRRPPGKVELILQATPVRSVILHMYGGARGLGAIYCSKPERIPSPPPPRLPERRWPPVAPTAQVSQSSTHVNDHDAAIAGATVLSSASDSGPKSSGLVRLASAVVAVSLFAMAMLAGGARFLMRAVSSLRFRLRTLRWAKRIVRGERVARSPCSRHSDASRPARVASRLKLIFDDQSGEEVATFVDLEDVGSIEELQALALQVYESAACVTDATDDEDAGGFELHYRDRAGRLHRVSDDTLLKEVQVNAELLRLKRLKGPQSRRTTGGYAIVACHAAPPSDVYEPNAAALRRANVSHYDADSFSTLLSRKVEPTAAALKQVNSVHYDTDSFSMLLSSRETASSFTGTGTSAVAVSRVAPQGAPASFVCNARAGFRSKPHQLGTIYDEQCDTRDGHPHACASALSQAGCGCCSGQREGLREAQASMPTHHSDIDEGDVEWHVHTVDAGEVGRGERLAL